MSNEKFMTWLAKAEVSTTRQDCCCISHTIPPSCAAPVWPHTQCPHDRGHPAPATLRPPPPRPAQFHTKGPPRLPQLRGGTGDRVRGRGGACCGRGGRRGQDASLCACPQVTQECNQKTRSMQAELALLMISKQFPYDEVVSVSLQQHTSTTVSHS